MSQAGKASNNVYTVLSLVAVIVLLVAIGYIWVRSSQLYKAGPFKLLTIPEIRSAR